jgi:hypothetical protein
VAGDPDDKRATALPLKGLGAFVGCFYMTTPSRLRASAGAAATVDRR